MSDERTEIVPTTELAEGDLVLNYGMRLRLEQRTEQPGRPRDWLVCVRFVGVIENFDEITDPFIRSHASALYTGDERPTWTVQGNELARWVRVIETRDWSRGTFRPECPLCGGYLLPCTATATGIHPGLPTR
jgi:hypothetical protein